MSVDLERQVRDWWIEAVEDLPSLRAEDFSAERPRPTPLVHRRALWVAAAAAVLTLLVLGAIPLLQGPELAPTDTLVPTTVDTVPTTTTTTATTVATTTQATVAEPAAGPISIDLAAAVAVAVERDARYRVLSLHTSRHELPPLGVNGESWDTVPDEWGREPWQWAIHPRSEDLFAALEPAPETKLHVWTEVWLARFSDAEAARAFVADYAEGVSDWAWIPSRLPCDGGSCPVDPLRFSVDVPADDSFGFTQEGFSTIVGVRQGSIVALAGIPHHDHPLRPVPGMIDEARYLAASLAAAIAGEVPEVEPPVVEPFTEQQSNAISLIQQFHEALNQGDYLRIGSMVRFSLHDPRFIEQMAEAHDPLLQQGAVFEARQCRPTQGEGDPVEEVFGVECLAGYRAGTEHFTYVRFFYDRGKLTEGGHLGYG